MKTFKNSLLGVLFVTSLFFGYKFFTTPAATGYSEEAMVQAVLEAKTEAVEGMVSQDEMNAAVASARAEGMESALALALAVVVDPSVDLAAHIPDVIDHVVVSGQGLDNIRDMYKVDVAEIKAMNGLTSDMLQIGQILQVPSHQVKKFVKNESHGYPIWLKWIPQQADLNSKIVWTYPGEYQGQPDGECQFDLTWTTWPQGLDYTAVIWRIMPEEGSDVLTCNIGTPSFVPTK